MEGLSALAKTLDDGGSWLYLTVAQRQTAITTTWCAHAACMLPEYSSPRQHPARRALAHLAQQEMHRRCTLNGASPMRGRKATRGVQRREGKAMSNLFPCLLDPFKYGGERAVCETARRASSLVLLVSRAEPFRTEVEGVSEGFVDAIEDVRLRHEDLASS